MELLKWSRKSSKLSFIVRVLLAVNADVDIGSPIEHDGAHRVLCQDKFTV